LIQPIVRYEGFGDFPVEQKALFDALVAERIDGLVFVSGDRHHSELLRVTWDGAAYPWYEFTSSPLTAGAHGGHPDDPARGLALGARELEAEARAALLELGQVVIDMGGSPMSEHGVGRNEVKKQLLLRLYGERGVQGMRAVKHALDPKGLLAPGVLF